MKSVKGFRLGWWVGVSLILSSGLAQAMPVDVTEAYSAMQGWLSLDSTPLGTQLDQDVSDVLTISDDTDVPLAYVFHLAPGGYVITSADDGLEPIIAFSNEGRFDESTESPLYQLLVNDVPGRLAANNQLADLPPGVTVEEDSPEAEAQEAAADAGLRWETLLTAEPAAEVGDPVATADTAGDIPAQGVGSISTVIVAPFVTSTWNQSSVGGQYCYNTYTPNHWVCGCVATALAQVLRYFQYPTAPIGQITRTVYVNGSGQSATTLGGDGVGGAYNWSLMPLNPSISHYNSNPENFNMIGRISYDAGVAVNMMYGSGGSGAYISKYTEAFKDVFQYTNVINTWTASTNDPAFFRPVFESNLLAGYPVIMAILSSGGGHAVVADGYGLNGGTKYYHVNLGWGGSATAWYNLPTVDTGYYNFTSIYGLTYNIFTTQTGELISGRVLEGSTPLSGVAVTATPRGGGSVIYDTTDAYGNYGFISLSSKTYDLVFTKTGYGNASAVATTGLSAGNGANGNALVDNVTMTKTRGFTSAVALQDRIILRWQRPTYYGYDSDTVYIRRSTSSYPVTSSDGELVYTGTDQVFEDDEGGDGLVSGQAYYYTLWFDTEGEYTSLPAGATSTARGTPDPGRLKLFWFNTSTGGTSSWILTEAGAIKSTCQIVTTAIPTTWVMRGSGDIDQDGISDLIWQNTSTGYVSYWLLNSDGTRKSAGNVYSSPVNVAWQVKGVGDIDQDGTVDLIFFNVSTGAVSYWMLNSDGTRRSAGQVVASPIPTSWRLDAMGDIDRDGTPDLIWRRTTDGQTAFWLLNADGTKKSNGNVISSGPGTIWQIQKGGDIDGDGTMDLIWRKTSDGSVSYWLLNANGTQKSAGAVYGTPVSLSWVLEGMGDVDNDGVPDLVWRNSSDGRVNHWLLNADGTRKTAGVTRESGSLAGWGLKYTGL